MPDTPTAKLVKVEGQVNDDRSQYQYKLTYTKDSEPGVYYEFVTAWHDADDIEDPVIIFNSESGLSATVIFE